MKSTAEGQAVIDAIPFDRPGTPVFFDRLGEIGTHKFGARQTPVWVVVPQDDAFGRPEVIAALVVLQLIGEAIELVMGLWLQQGHGRQLQQRSDLIAPLAAPEALRRAVGDVEQQKGIRQVGVGHRMAGGAPLAVQDQVAMVWILQEDLEVDAMNLEPSLQAAELAGVGSLEIITSLLNLELAAGVEREADVGAVDFLFDGHRMAKKVHRFLSAEHLVIADGSAAEPGEMGGVGEAEEGNHWF